MDLVRDIKALPWPQQYPSHRVNQMRAWLPEKLEQQSLALMQRSGRTYGKRFGKAVSIWSMGLALLPIEHEIMASGACWHAAKRTPLARYEKLACPFVPRPVPSWVLVGAAFACVGVGGGAQTDEPAEADASSSGAEEALPAQAAAPPDAQRLAWWHHVALSAQKWSAIGVRVGVLGLAHEALDARAQLYREQGYNKLAEACRLGAMSWRVLLEPARLLLQSASLLADLALATPCAAFGAVVGTAVFFSNVHLDRWGEVQHNMVVT